MGVPLKGLYRDYIGVMEKKMEATIQGLGDMLLSRNRWTPMQTPKH